MKKLLKISLLLVTLLAFSINLSVYATNTESIENSDTYITAVGSTSSSSSKDSSSTTVSSVNPISDGELTISDILNILLIATGVVIILLAIAIFIKLK